LAQGWRDTGTRDPGTRVTVKRSCAVIAIAYYALVSREGPREIIRTANGWEYIMNQIETNVVEVEATEQPDFAQTVIELNSAQLVLVGGGSGIISLD
jgi:hypothetical protein